MRKHMRSARGDEVAQPGREDVDLPTLGRALWRAKGWILGLARRRWSHHLRRSIDGRPLFTSEARILIQNDELAFTPPADERRDPRLSSLDEQAVESQVQVMTSRDLAVDVVKALDLTNNPDFAKDEGLSFVRRILNAIGPRASPKSEEEKAANTFADNLDVFQLAKSSVIAIKYTSGDSPLAAKIANQLADAYVEWQRNTKPRRVDAPQTTETAGAGAMRDTDIPEPRWWRKVCCSARVVIAFSVPEKTTSAKRWRDTSQSSCRRRWISLRDNRDL